MEILGRSNPPSYHHHTHGSATPVTVPKPEPAPTPVASGSKPHLLYRCLLNQHAQKMRKSLPIYQTPNEGSDHLPKFRSTVSFDGDSYTSSNTFPNLKMAEMDVSKIAYIAMIQKSKSEALRHILEDKSICKSIMIEFSVKMKFERPKYVTSCEGGSIPVFSSHLSFNGATFPGDNAKSKKEAEQFAARAVILNYLDSEFANDMAEVINSKFRHAKVLTEPTRLAPSVVTQPPMIEPITPAAPVVNQSQTAKVVTEPLTPAAPVVTQSLTPKVPTKPITPAAPVVTQPLTPVVLTKPITPAAPVVTHPLIPKTEPITSTAPVVTQPSIPKIEPITHPTATVVTHPCIPKIEPTTPVTAGVVTRSRIPKVSTESVSKTVPEVTQPSQEGIRSAVSRPVVFAPTPSAQVNMVASAPRSGQLASNLSLDRSVERKRLTLQTPGRKRYCEDNKNAQKKMRVDTQRPVPGMQTSPSQPFWSQSSLSKGNGSRMPHKNAFRR